jgi:hypothetical protein
MELYGKSETIAGRGSAFLPNFLYRNVGAEECDMARAGQRQDGTIFSCTRRHFMFIAWQQFTPWSALLGGALIGLAASLFILVNGRVAGISGILGGLLTPAQGDVSWRIAFLGCLVAAPLV